MIALSLADLVRTSGGGPADCAAALAPYNAARRHTEDIRNNAPENSIAEAVAKAIRIERARREEHAPMQNLLAACDERSPRWRERP